MLVLDPTRKIIFVGTINEVSEQVGHLVSSHCPPTGTHSIVSAHMPWFKVHMRGRYEAVLSSAPCMRLCTLKGWMPIAPAVEAGVVYVGCSVGTSSCGASWPSASLRRSPSQRVVEEVMCAPISDVWVKEVQRNFSLLPIIVKMGGNAQGYLGGSQALFYPFFFLFKLPFGQVEVLLLSLNASPLVS